MVGFVCVCIILIILWIVIRIILNGPLFNVQGDEPDTQVDETLTTNMNIEKQIAEEKQEDSWLNEAVERMVKDVAPIFRMMVLANEPDCWERPRIYSSDDGVWIILEKRGEDLCTRNLKDYYNGTSRDGWEKALNRFKEDLFRERAGQVNFNMVYLADHLIKVDDLNKYDSDYTLTYRFRVPFKRGTSEFYKFETAFYKEIHKTKILSCEE